MNLKVKDTEAPYITGFYGCSCHPFNSWMQSNFFHKQKFKVGDGVKNRCNGMEGIVTKPTCNMGFCVVQYGPLERDKHLEHSASLYRL